MRPRPGKARRQTFPPPSPGLREGRRAMRMRLFQRAGSHRCTASTASSTRPPFPARKAAPLALVSSGDGQRQFAKSRSDVRTCSQPPRRSKPFPVRRAVPPSGRGRFPCFSNLFRRRAAPLALVSSGDGQRQFAKSRSDVRTCSQPPRLSKPFPVRGAAAPPRRGRFPCFSNLFQRARPRPLRWFRQAMVSGSLQNQDQTSAHAASRRAAQNLFQRAGAQRLQSAGVSPAFQTFSGAGAQRLAPNPGTRRNGGGHRLPDRMLAPAHAASRRKSAAADRAWVIDPRVQK